MSLEFRAGLSEAEIVRRVQAHLAGDPPRLQGYRSAAVLVPFVWKAGQWHLLFTRRTETVQSHKGQVSFPGGGAESGDNTPEDTALREAFEEIGLLPNDVHLIGRLGHMATVSNYLVTVVLGRIEWPYSFQLSQAEVSRVFTIPIEWLANPANREEHPRALPSGVVENIIYYRPYDGETLWGISARITVDLLNVLDTRTIGQEYSGQ